MEVMVGEADSETESAHRLWGQEAEEEMSLLIHSPPLLHLHPPLTISSASFLPYHEITRKQDQINDQHSRIKCLCTSSMTLLSCVTLVVCQPMLKKTGKVCLLALTQRAGCLPCPLKSTTITCSAHNSPGPHSGCQRGESPCLFVQQCAESPCCQVFGSVYSLDLLLLVLFAAFHTSASMLMTE